MQSLILTDRAAGLPQVFAARAASPGAVRRPRHPKEATIIRHPADKPRLLRVRLDGRHARGWQVDLLGRLSAVPGLSVDVDLTARGPVPPTGVSMLFRLEGLLHGLPEGGAAATVDGVAFAPFRLVPGARPDLTLDLAGDEAPASGRRWVLLFDGVPGEIGLLAALLAGRTPVAELREAGLVLAAGRLGTEYGGVIRAAFADMLARCVTLIVAAVTGGASATLPDLPDGAAAPAAGSDPMAAPALARRAGKQVARRLVQQLYHLVSHAPHWRTGWRRLEGGDLFDLRRHPPGGWHDLPDDRKRFYADPFPLARDGGTTLFVEEFPHRTGKGLIAALRFGPDGPVGTPVPVLEQPAHLSYPFVFVAEGAVWMIPESLGAASVDLFRATAFPGGWVREATLLSGLAASDATLVEEGGRWWLFATVRDGGGAFSDALHLWSAPDFRGPFTPHPGNPVLIDIASARPAGAMVRRGGALFRPVQDCRRGYGAALGIARVTRLDDQGFEQAVETILTAGPLWPGRRIHTLNAGGGFEFIDGSRFAPRWGRRA